MSRYLVALDLALAMINAAFAALFSWAGDTEHAVENGMAAVVVLAILWACGRFQDEPDDA